MCAEHELAQDMLEERRGAGVHRRSRRAQQPACADAERCFPKSNGSLQPQQARPKIRAGFSGSKPEAINIAGSAPAAPRRASGASGSGSRSITTTSAKLRASRRASRPANASANDDRASPPRLPAHLILIVGVDVSSPDTPIKGASGPLRCGAFEWRRLWMFK